MKIRLSFLCLAALALYGITFLLFSVRESDAVAWGFIVVVSSITTLLSIINSFLLLYLLKLKTMNRYESPCSVPDPVTGCSPTSDPCASKPAA
jgi:hypothetical protein